MSKQDILDLLNQIDLSGNLNMIANYFIKEYVAYSIIAILFLISAIVLYIVAFKKGNKRFITYDKTLGYKFDPLDDLPPLGWIAASYIVLTVICAIWVLGSNIFWIIRWSIAPMAALLEMLTTV